MPDQSATVGAVAGQPLATSPLGEARDTQNIAIDDTSSAQVLVQWDESDPDNPQNWNVWFKSWLTLQLGLLAFSGSLGSSVISPAGPVIAAYLGISDELAVLTVSLYIVGFAIGPLVWAPLSEVFGRRLSMLPALTCLGLFSLGTAVSRNTESVFITRLLGGTFGSAAISNVSAALGDFWSRETRGTAMTFYAIAVIGGAVLGPVVGAAVLVTPKLGWRWTEYIEVIVNFTVVAVTLVCLPETYGPVLLKRKAIRLRKETGDMRYYHPQEEIKLDVKSIVTKQLSRPLIMLFTEPMVACIAFYASFVYAMLYLAIQVVHIVYSEQRQWSPLVGSLPMLSFFVGILAALGINLGYQPYYVRASRKAHGRPVPEARLPPVAIGGVLFAVGLFWFGWTSSPWYVATWVPSVIALAFIGAGFNAIFQQCLNFLVDTYGQYAASATAANTFLRSVLAAGLPVATQPMLTAMGTGPALSMLGAVATLLIPVPFIFMKYGKQLRKRSHFAPYKGDDISDESGDEEKGRAAATIPSDSSEIKS